MVSGEASDKVMDLDLDSADDTDYVPSSAETVESVETVDCDNEQEHQLDDSAAAG